MVDGCPGAGMDAVNFFCAEADQDLPGDEFRVGGGRPSSPPQEEVPMMPEKKPSSFDTLRTALGSGEATASPPKPPPAPDQGEFSDTASGASLVCGAPPDEIEKPPKPEKADVRALKGFGGLDAECLGEVVGAMRPVVEERTAPKPKPKVVNVPVFATLLVKRLSEDHHSGDVKLEATMIQRTLFADPLLIREAAGSSTPDDEASLLGFEMRVNDSLDKDTLIHVRKTMRGTLGDSAPGQTFCAVTASAELPLVLVPLVDCQPFGIRALELTLEYSSFVSQVPGGDIYNFRPDLLCHVEDLRNLVCVKNWNGEKRESLDQMYSWDLINTSPTVEFLVEASVDKGSGQCKTVYCPRVRLTWFVTKDWLDAFITTMLPVLFVAMGNMLNGIYCLPGADDHMGHGIVDDDWNHDNPEDVQAQRGAFFANQLTLALTLVFMIPQLRSTSSLSNQASSNDTFVGLLFFGLCVGLWGGINRSHRVFLHVSNYILFGTLVVPVKHMTHYMRIRKTIHKAFRHDESPLCFNGRPGKPKKKAGGGKAGGGDVDVSTLAHFYAFDAAKAIHANDAISKHPDSPWRRTTSKAGVLESVYCGIRSEDIKTDVFSWGQPPQLTIDSIAKKAHGSINLGAQMGADAVAGLKSHFTPTHGEAKIGDEAGGSQVTENTGYAWKMGRDNMSTTAVRTAK